MKTVLHFLSVVSWDNLEVDSNFEVFLKTIRWLADCHHYVLVPWRVFEFVGDMLLDASYTLLSYEYPGNALAARHEFRSAEFAKSVNLRKMDVDLLFCHQPELMGNLMAALSTKRAGNALISFVFFHWVDCAGSRGSGGSVSVSHRQAEAIELADRYFVHGTSTYANAFRTNLHKSALMPLSAAPLPEGKAPPNWDNEKPPYVVFNHRRAHTTGWKQLEQWIPDGVPIVYTRNGKEGLSRDQYRYVLEHSLCAVCMISGYATWNMAVQDPLRLGVPLLCREHPVIRSVVGQHPDVVWFSDKASFQKGLQKVYREKGKPRNPVPLEDFDANFRANFLGAIRCEWQKKEANHRGGSKHTARWKEEIAKVPGITKAEIIRKVHGPTASAHASWQFIRRDLLRAGYESVSINGETRYIPPLK